MKTETATATHWSDAWAIHRPCAEGLAFARSTATLAEFWATCPRGDWMLWMISRTCGDRRQLTLAACACARLALPHVTAGETRPLAAIETTERWARGDTGVTLASVLASADAAERAADAAMGYAADAARSAADAVEPASGADTATLAQCADIVRQFFPMPPTV